MPPNKTEKFITAAVKRSAVGMAEYNPRKISKAAEKKLRKFMRETGNLQPLIWNKQTGNLVAGHQRLKAMDAINRAKEYELTVSVVDLTPEQEVKANVFLNNPSAMGEWDSDKLVEIFEEFPDLDFKADLGFDQEDLEFMFSGTDAFEEISGHVDAQAPPPEEKDEVERMKEIDKLKEAKRGYKEQAREDNADGTTHQVEQDDYMVTFVFNNNSEKAEFMHRIKKPPKERFLKGSVLVDIGSGQFEMTGAVE